MKCHCHCITTAIAVVLLSVLSYGQADQHNHEAGASQPTASAQPSAQAPAANKTPAPKSEAQLSFDAIKTLAGEWEGTVRTDFPGVDPMKDIPLHVTMRVTSRGNLLVHEFQQTGTPLDFTKYDHPVTMIYVDQDKLNLVHYCDAGNRPRMTARVSPDKKTLEFDFAELSGSDKYGHMYHSIFELIDADHHSEDWTFMVRGKDGELKPIHAKMEMHRVKQGCAGCASTGGSAQ